MATIPTRRGQYTRGGGRRFRIALKKFVEETTPEQFAALKQGIAIETLRGVVLKSPVDTGRFRGNWQVAEGAPITTEIERLDRQGNATLAEETPKITAVEPGGDIWISNNVPYAIALENGHSRQAPAGVVALTVAEIESRFR